jgi:hypothetical protein
MSKIHRFGRGPAAQTMRSLAHPTRETFPAARTPARKTAARRATSRAADALDRFAADLLARLRPACGA